MVAFEKLADDADERLLKLRSETAKKDQARAESIDRSNKLWMVGAAIPAVAAGGVGAYRLYKYLKKKKKNRGKAK